MMINRRRAKRMVANLRQAQLQKQGRRQMVEELSLQVSGRRFTRGEREAHGMLRSRRVSCRHGPAEGRCRELRLGQCHREIANQLEGSSPPATTRRLGPLGLIGATSVSPASSAGGTDASTSAAASTTPLATTETSSEEPSAGWFAPRQKAYKTSPDSSATQKRQQLMPLHFCTT